jgi:hypothetical protein
MNCCMFGLALKVEPRSDTNSGPKPWTGAHKDSLGGAEPSHLGRQSPSARQAAILGSLLNGALDKVIARKLDVAEATAKVRVRAVLQNEGVVRGTPADKSALHSRKRGRRRLHMAVDRWSHYLGDKVQV